MELHGINGNVLRAIGLVDSGADVTCMPMVLAALLGYRREHLERIAIQQLGGGKEAWRATQPVRARLLGVPDFEISLLPVFAEGSRRSL